MVTTIVPPTLASGGTVTYAPAPQGTAYKYDRLNRLKSSKAWQDIDAVGNLWATGDGSSYAGMYENNFSYDANGNITAQMRKDATGTAINDLTYNRRNVGGKTVQNRLYHVNDAVSNTAFTDDIDDQDPFINNELVNSVNNYGYDEIGNLNRNNQKEIAEMVYNVTGKVKEVHRTVGSNKENLKFDYDANGNRIAKHVYTSDDVWMKSDYYVNDAQGNNMAIYTLTGSSGAGLSYQLAERNVYGSSRVGTNKTPVEMIGVIPQTDYTHTLGDRNYFLSNHINNTLVTVTDKKLPIDNNNDLVIDEYWPHVISSADYYSYGVKMKERSFSTESTRYQFNGKEYDSETETTNQGARNSDGDLGIMETPDAAAGKTPDVSPYSLNNNNPIININPDGNEVKNAHKEKRNEAKQKRDDAKTTFDAFGGNKKQEGYKQAKKDYKQAEREFKPIDEKYQAVQNAIEYLKINYESEFNYLNTLTAGDQVIDIDITASKSKFYHMTEDPLQATAKEYADGKRQNATGFTQDFRRGNGQFHRNKEGNLSFNVGVSLTVINKDGVAKTLYHEFRHVFYKMNPFDLKGKDEETKVQEDTENNFK